MHTVTLPTTKARNQFFDLVNAARYNNQVTVIIQSGQAVAQIVPIEKKKIDWKNLNKNLQKVAGIFTQADEDFILHGRKTFDRDLGDW